MWSCNSSLLYAAAAEAEAATEKPAAQPEDGATAADAQAMVGDAAAAAET